MADSPPLHDDSGSCQMFCHACAAVSLVPTHVFARDAQEEPACPACASTFVEKQNIQRVRRRAAVRELIQLQFPRLPKHSEVKQRNSEGNMFHKTNNLEKQRQIHLGNYRRRILEIMEVQSLYKEIGS